ncbi:metallophosphoesterase family protein, partial [Pseudomaricurvus sp.]|uniref:metallophosphoesterase family protein n=1 Tax=Pseudomaricurvus sp. TaxID=2004510 RepID=UPI003F6CCB62
MNSDEGHPMRRTTLLLCALILSCLTIHSAGTHAAKDTPTSEKPLRIAVISDMNSSYGSTQYSATVDRAIENLIQLKPDLVISTGDMVAGQKVPHLSDKQVHAMWRGFHRHVTTPLLKAKLPLAVTAGNHDGSAYAGFEHERRIYGEQWIRHRPALTFLDDKHYPYYYAFEKKGVLFVGLDVTTTGDLSEDQKNWLYNILSAYGKRYSHRIVFSHVPLWPLAQGRENGYSGDRELEKMLRDHKVDLYLSGHHHAFYPGYKDDLYLVGMSC